MRSLESERTCNAVYSTRRERERERNGTTTPRLPLGLVRIHLLGKLDRLVHLVDLGPEPLRAVVLAAALAADEPGHVGEPRLCREAAGDDLALGDDVEVRDLVVRRDREEVRRLAERLGLVEAALEDLSDGEWPGSVPRALTGER